MSPRPLIDSELLEAGDRAIDRALQWVMADDHRVDGRRRYRLHNVIRLELDQLEQNLFENGQGLVRFNVDIIFVGPGVPELRVKFARQRVQAQAL